MLSMNTEIVVEVNPASGTWEEAEKIIKKICETQNDITCTLRIEVKRISN